MFYIGLEVYDEAAAASVIDNKAYGGVVLGDLFCNKRMFEDETFGLLDIAAKVKAAGKAVCLQTNMYMTERIFADTRNLIRRMVSLGILDMVLLQDVGLVNAIHKEFPELELCWNCIGIGRSRVSNEYYYRALADFGVKYFQCENVMVADALISKGFGVAPIYGKLSYNTLNRECYYMYENNIFDKECGRGCLSCKQKLVNANTGFTMTIDGYMLGRRYVYEEKIDELKALEAKGYPVFVYGEKMVEVG